MKGDGWREELLRSGYAQVGFAALTAGMVGPLIRIINLPVTAIALGRFAFAWLALLASRALWGQRTSIRAKELRGTLVLIGCSTAASTVSFMAAFRFIPVAKAVLLAFCTPVIVALLAHRFLGERIRGLAVVALILSGAGAAIIVAPGARDAPPGEWWGMALALGSACVAAVEVILIKRIAGQVSAETLNLYRYGTAAALVAPLAFTGHWHASGPDGILVLMLGVVHTAVIGTIYVAGLGKAEAHKASILSYLEPLSATVLAWIFLAEQPTPATVLGGGLILMGSYLVVRRAVVAV